MGLLGALLGTTRVQIIQNKNTVVQLDCSVKESHGRKSPPTEFPVEDGDTVSDHIIIKPLTLELTGIISDTPIGGISGILTETATTVTSKLLPPKAVAAAGAGVGLLSSIVGSKSPSAAAYNQLLALQAAAMPVDILTSLYRYSSMWISDISAPRDSDTGKVLLFTVSLVQLILVQPQSVNIAVFANPELSGAEADLGNQSNIPNGFQAGFTNTTNAINAIVPGGSS